jgi:Mannosyltransferase (PIG-V)
MVIAVLRRQPALGLWTQWDGKWYLGIAAHGYHWGLHGKSALAFFPLYPLLVRVGMNLPLPSTFVALTLSNLAFAGALFYLYRLVALERGSAPARTSVWLMALFPTAFFTFAPYTEALFLLCAIGALYHARRGQAVEAGLWMAAAILTRSTGIILVPAVLLALGSVHWRRWLHALAPSLLAGIAYLDYLVSQRLSLAALLDAEQAWHRTWTFPWMGFAASIEWLADHGSRLLPWAVENILQLCVTLMFLALTALAWRYLDQPARVYCVGFWLLVLTSPEWRNGYYAPFSSMDRFVLSLFPLAGWAAAHVPVRRPAFLATTSTAAMLAAAAVHLSGGWVG